MDVMNPTFQDIKRALDLLYQTDTDDGVGATERLHRRAKLVETFGLSSHIVSLHLSDGETVADIEPCLQGGCGIIYDR